MDKLPTEILERIFLWCLRSNDNYDTALSIRVPPPASVREPPLLLTRVASRWRNISVHQPILWTDLHVARHHRVYDKYRALKLWLSRSRNCQLALTFIHDGGYKPVECLVRFIRRCEYLVVNVNSAPLLTLILDTARLAPALRELSFEDRCKSESVDRHQYSIDPGIVYKLRALECQLHSSVVLHSPVVLHIPVYPCHRLRALALETLPALRWAEVLRWFDRCPNLEKFRIAVLYNSDANRTLSLTIHRSILCNLRVLSLVLIPQETYGADMDAITKFMILLPSLRTLSIQLGTKECWESVASATFVKLSNFTRHLLSESTLITHLTLRHMGSHTTLDGVADLFRALPLLKTLVVHDRLQDMKNILLLLIKRSPILYGTASRCPPSASNATILPRLSRLIIKTINADGDEGDIQQNHPAPNAGMLPSTVDVLEQLVAVVCTRSDNWMYSRTARSKVPPAPARKYSAFLGQSQRLQKFTFSCCQRSYLGSLSSEVFERCKHQMFLRDHREVQRCAEKGLRVGVSRRE